MQKLNPIQKFIFIMLAVAVVICIIAPLIDIETFSKLVLGCASIIGAGAVIFAICFFIFDPSTNRFCKSIEESKNH